MKQQQLEAEIRQMEKLNQHALEDAQQALDDTQQALEDTKHALQDALDEALDDGRRDAERARDLHAQVLRQRQTIISLAEQLKRRNG